MLHSLLAIVLLLCSAPAAPLRQKRKYEPLISDIQFLVPLNNFRGVGEHSNNQPDLSKASKSSKKHELSDGPYSHIPDEEFTFDDTGDFPNPTQKTVKKDLGRDKFINFKSSDQRNHNPRSSQTLYTETNAQKYIARKCKLFLQRVESQSRYKDQPSESDLLNILCKIYVRPSVNGMDFVTPDRESDKLDWPGEGQFGSRGKVAGILDGNIDVENDLINSFLSGIHMAGNNRVLENMGINGFGGCAGNLPVGGEGYVGNVGVDGTEEGMVVQSSVLLPLFGKLGVGGKAGQDGQAYSGKDNLINYQSTVHKTENSDENGLKLKNTNEDNKYRCLVESFGINADDLGNDKDGNGNVSSSNCLHLIFLKKAAQAGQPASSDAPGSPLSLQKFRPMGGRRQWLAMGGADDNRLRQYVSMKKPWLII